MKQVLIVAGGGIGDCIQGLQCAEMAFRQRFNPTILIASRENVYNPLNYLFGGDYNVVYLGDKYTREQLNEDQQFIQDLKSKYNCTHYYYHEPDLLYRNPCRFDFEYFLCNPQTIRQQRLLLHRWKPEKIIYVGLVSTTEGYLYSKIPELLLSLAVGFPDYEIYFPNVEKWADKTIKYGEFSNLPKNVTIDNNPTIEQSFEILMKSVYGIYTDNGPSHISFQLGQNRLLLDPRFGIHRSSVPWIARWRESIEDSIPIQTPPEEVTKLVKVNLEVPQTLLLPKAYVVNQLQSNWSESLYFKY